MEPRAPGAGGVGQRPAPIGFLLPISSWSVAVSYRPLTACHHPFPQSNLLSCHSFLACIWPLGALPHWPIPGASALPRPPAWSKGLCLVPQAAHAGKRKATLEKHMSGSLPGVHMPGCSVLNMLTQPGRDLWGSEGCGGKQVRAGGACSLFGGCQKWVGCFAVTWFLALKGVQVGTRHLQGVLSLD